MLATPTATPVFLIRLLQDQTTSTGTVVEEHVPLSAFAAHLRGFEEDSRSEVVFWIEEWSIEFHRRGTCAVECVAAHLRGFEEDSRSEVVFWIEEWSIEFHRRGTCAVECVAAHLRGFEEDSRSEVVFWIEEWSIEFHRRGICAVECRCSTSSRV